MSHCISVRHTNYANVSETGYLLQTLDMDGYTFCKPGDTDSIIPQTISWNPQEKKTMKCLDLEPDVRAPSYNWGKIQTGF